ncbi:TfoX/Sxy family protein [Kiloniella antarctica]|uniref:TfoX/Sxy family protein n=1 Tax=Kiloniella antarctica TaxID=1550907 RepID=A0ABW5BEV7_9PROT
MKKKRPSSVEETINYCLPLGPVRVKSMFGGHGLYFEDIMFALEANGDIYLKTDKETLNLFEEAGSQAFTYEGKNKPITMSYSLIPSTAWDDQDDFIRWVNLAIGASRRAKATKKLKNK